MKEKIELEGNWGDKITVEVDGAEGGSYWFMDGEEWVNIKYSEIPKLIDFLQYWQSQRKG